MPSFHTGRVERVMSQRDGLQRVEVELPSGRERAYVLTQLTGPVAVGDHVVVNTTAVELGLGTGGWHVVHWNLAREEYDEPGPGHIIKARYTSLQADVGSAEEHHRELLDVDSIDGLPVVAASLHSQLPAIVAAIREARPEATIAYVMTDGAGLPLAMSDLLNLLRIRGLVDTTITTGHAFGGDYEAVNVYSALAVAKHLAGADVAVVTMGPGIVGTGTRLGFTGMEVGAVLDAAVGLGGRPIATLRASEADERERHQGVSHHTLTALGVGTRSRVSIPIPAGEWADRLRAELVGAGLDARHDLVEVDAPDPLALFERHVLRVSSMGRPAEADPVLFACAAAAGTLAAERI